MDIGSSKLGQGNCGHSIVGEVEQFTRAGGHRDVFAAPNSAV